MHISPDEGQVLAPGAAMRSKVTYLPMLLQDVDVVVVVVVVVVVAVGGGGGGGGGGVGGS